MVGLSLLLAIGCAPPAAEKSPDEAAAEAPPGLGYVPPEPGSYQLPPIQAAADGAVLYSHVLKVFLIDRERQVRNIYSSSFLHPALVVNDVKTLMLEEKSTG